MSRSVADRMGLIHTRFTVTGGEITSSNGFYPKYKEKHCHFGGVSRQLLSSSAFHFSLSRTELRLVELSIPELYRQALHKEPRRDLELDRESIIKMGLDQEFRLCPQDGGPNLRWQYIAHPSKPKREQLFFAMNPVIDGQGKPQIFGLYRGDKRTPFEERLWLTTHEAGPQNLFKITDSWIFLDREQVVVR